MAIFNGGVSTGAARRSVALLHRPARRRRSVEHQMLGLGGPCQSMTKSSKVTRFVFAPPSDLAGSLVRADLAAFPDRPELDKFKHKEGNSLPPPSSGRPCRACGQAAGVVFLLPPASFLMNREPCSDGAKLHLSAPATPAYLGLVGVANANW
ncbi:hypothetical protein VTJ49DRAFT_843 [Mycothermus thermophilus]|uniref:Uncharacterized protein n=1 Tax=Humicola insolens TaxID=85995 RepID=A0ABR3VED4_HUMIN